jgi:hypothetical protein
VSSATPRRYSTVSALVGAAAQTSPQQTPEAPAAGSATSDGTGTLRRAIDPSAATSSRSISGGPPASSYSTTEPITCSVTSRAAPESERPRRRRTTADGRTTWVWAET